MKGIDLVLLTKFQSLETPDDRVIVQIGGIFLENFAGGVGQKFPNSETLKQKWNRISFELDVR